MRKTLKQEIETRRISKELDNLLSFIEKGLKYWKKDFPVGLRGDYTEKEVVYTLVRSGSKVFDWIDETLNLLGQSFEDFTETYMSLIENKVVLIPIPPERVGDGCFIKVRRK